MRLEVLNHIPDDLELRRSWNNLALKMPRPEVFYTYEWAIAVQRAYGEQLRPLIFLGYDEQNILCGIAALARKAEDSSVCFLGATTGDYCDFVSAPESASVFASLVLKELRKRGTRKAVFTNLPADSATAKEMGRLGRDSGFFHFARTAYICARVMFNQLEKGKDGAPIAPGLKRIRRFAKAMGSEAPIQFEHLRSWSSVEGILPEFAKAHVARFLATGRISNVASGKRRIFLAELAKLLSETQWLVLSRMMAGNKPVAWHYGFHYHDAWFWYQPTFESEVEKHWPGFCLLTQVIHEGIQIPSLKAIDLGLGSEAYKAKFANASRETIYVALHTSFLAHAGAMFRDGSGNAVRKIPQVERFAELARQKLRSFRNRLGNDGAKRMLAWTAKRTLRLLRSKDEVFFYELTGNASSADSRNLSLKPIDLNMLAAAAMQYEGDEETLAYLLRCAKRLQKKEHPGFVLSDAEDGLVHFLWTGPFAGFRLDELSSTLPDPPADSVLIFDAWTPPRHRGRGYYASALRLAAGMIRESGKQAWIFSAAENAKSRSALETEGFPRRFSVTRHKVLAWQHLSRNEAHNSIASQPLAALRNS